MRTVWHSMTRTGSVPGSRRAGCLALLGALALAGIGVAVASVARRTI